MGPAVVIFGVDTGSRSLREADHLIHAFVDRFRLPGETVACTHLIRGEHPHVAVSLTAPQDLWPEFVQWAETEDASIASDTHGPADLSHAVADHTARTAGRAVVFPGSDLGGTVRVGDLLERSAITRLHVIGGPDQPAPDDVLDTRDHLRPEWRAGELVLVVTPAGRGRFAPFEVPNPTPCCADHG